MQEGNGLSAVGLQDPGAGSTSGLKAGDGGGANAAGPAVPSVSADKPTIEMIRAMTPMDWLAGVALVVGLILVLRHFGAKKAGRAADENLAQLEQARLLAQAARFQAASDAAGERRAVSARSNEPRAGDGREARLARQVEQSIGRLEQLISDADRRIRRLEELGRQATTPRMTTGSAGATPAKAKSATGQAGGPAHEDSGASGEVSRGESRLIEPRAETAPDDWQSRTRQLAAAGLSAREIAFKLGKPIGHVELVLALQRGQIAG